MATEPTIELVEIDDGLAFLIPAGVVEMHRPLVVNSTVEAP